MSISKEIGTLSDEELTRRFQQTTDPLLITELLDRHQSRSKSPAIAG